MMQIWLLACTLKIWQVKTICPVGWSEEDGDGMEVREELKFVVGEGIGVNELNTEDVPTSVTTGEEKPEGVDACSVANRSLFGEDVGASSPHPSTKNSAIVIQISLFLTMIQLNGFKIEFLPCQNFCAETATMRTM